MDALALVTFRPAFGALAAAASPGDWIGREGSDHAVALAGGTALWLAGLWLGIGLFATVAAARPGHRRGWLARLSTLMVPAVLRRLVIASTAASLTMTPASPWAEAAAAAYATPATPATCCQIPSAAPAAGASNQSDRLPAAPPVVWPLDSSPQPGAQPASPTQPVALPSAGAAPRPAGAGQPPPDTAYAATTPTVPLEPASPGRQPPTEVVRPGDSLWLIAARQLGPHANESDVAVSWPYWYRSNRKVIGADPNLIQPGEVLTAPTSQEER